MVTTFNPYYDQGTGLRHGGNQLKRKLTRFFRAYNFSNIWYSIIREFCSHCVRKFAEAGWKICKIDQCGSVFFQPSPYVARLVGGAQFAGGRKLCTGVSSLMQMEFLKYCIIRTGDNMRYYHVGVFFGLAWIRFLSRVIYGVAKM